MRALLLGAPKAEHARLCRLLAATAGSGTPKAQRKRTKTAAAPDAKGGMTGGNASPKTGSSSVSLKEEVQQLEAALARHRELYFNQQPDISDAAYDDLKRRYRELAARLRKVAPEDVAVPVGAPVPAASALRKVRHPVPMLSLAAVNSREELTTWLTKTLAKLPAAGGWALGTAPSAAAAAGGSDSIKSSGKRAGRRTRTVTAEGPESAAAGSGALGGAPYSWVVEPKVDGLAVRVLYRRAADGMYELVEAATRGDGEVGEDVTHNALAGGIAGMPQRFAAPPLPAQALTRGSVEVEVEVRGEVYMRTRDLEQLNEELVAAGQQPYANSRNTASGALRLLDPAECRSRRLSFVAYQVVLLPGQQQQQQQQQEAVLWDSHWESLQWLQAAAFPTSPDNTLCTSAAEAVEAAEAWMGRRSMLGYDADGVVLKLDDTRQYGTLGAVGGDPKWAVAWKFPAGEAVTRVEGVELTVGRQGAITPVALLAPVALGGVTIRRASMHNVGQALGLGLHLGDAVVLRRSGDVIPQVLRVLPELRPPGAVRWSPPSACPACGGPVELAAATTKGGGDQLMCISPGCSAKAERELLHYAVTCLKGSNVGKGVVPLLVEAGVLAKVTDYYTLDQAVVAAIPGFGPARAASLAAATAASLRQPAAALLRGLNIRLVGDTAAGQLGRAFPRLAELVGASEADISAAAGVGPAVASNVAAWFRQPANRQLLRELAAAGMVCIDGPPAGAAAAAAAAAAPVAGRAGASRASGRGSKVQAPTAGAAAAAAAGSGGAAPARAGSSRGSGRGGAAEAVVEAAAEEEEGGGADGDGPLVRLNGLSVCITGTLMGPDGGGLSRDGAASMVEAAGGVFHKTVRSDTQVLLVGSKAGKNKLDSAMRKGPNIRVMYEEEFWSTYGRE